MTPCFAVNDAADTRRGSACTHWEYSAVESARTFTRVRSRFGRARCDSSSGTAVARDAPHL